MVDRQELRFRVSLGGKLVSGHDPYAVQFIDISRKGCRIKNTVRVVPGERVDLFLYRPDQTTPLFIMGAVIRWANRNGIGIEFQDIAPACQESLDLLVSLFQFRRQYPRFPALLSGKVMSADHLYPVTVVDLSRKGCRIKNNVELTPGNRIDLFLYTPPQPAPLVMSGAVIRWSNPNGIGLEFESLPMRLDDLVSRLEAGNN
ncbi:MAG TPA: PilZ domain-containing protein [Nitrospira sp.]|nr:PilZ domain-containing protein [Nitrospira sp.]